MKKWMVIYLKKHKEAPNENLWTIVEGDEEPNRAALVMFLDGYVEIVNVIQYEQAANS